MLYLDLSCKCPIHFNIIHDSFLLVTLGVMSSDLKPSFGRSCKSFHRQISPLWQQQQAWNTGANSKYLGRRVRGLYDHDYIFDTTEARHVWEHPYFPVFYIPSTAVKDGILTMNESVDKEGSAFIVTMKGEHKSTDRIISFEKGPLAGLVRFEFAALGIYQSCEAEFWSLLINQQTIGSKRICRFMAIPKTLTKGLKLFHLQGQSL